MELKRSDITIPFRNDEDFHFIMETLIASGENVEKHICVANERVFRLFGNTNTDVYWGTSVHPKGPDKALIRVNVVEAIEIIKNGRKENVCPRDV